MRKGQIMDNLINDTISANELDDLSASIETPIWYVTNADTRDVYAVYKDADGIDCEDVRNEFAADYPISYWSDCAISIWYRETPNSQYVMQSLELTDGELAAIDM